MVEKLSVRDLLLESDPTVESEFNSGTVLVKWILDNSVLNSTLLDYLQVYSVSSEAVKSAEYKMALLTLLFRSQGRLSTPEELPGANR